MVGKQSLVILVAGTIGAWSVFSQEKPTSGGSGDTGAGAWVVVKQDLNDFTNTGEKILGDFPSEEAAKAYAEKLNKDEKEWYRWTYTYRRRRQDDPKARALVENTTPKGGAIAKPNVKTVDPGEVKLGGEAVSVAGKTGTGTIGTAKVTIQFSGRAGRGRFVVSGELEGVGEWQQDGASLVMETALSKFRGVIRGNRLAGVRFTKKQGDDGKNALTEWSVALAETPKVDPQAYRVQFQLRGAKTIEKYYPTLEAAKSAAYSFIDEHSDPGGFFVESSVLVFDNRTNKHLETKVGKKGRP